MSLAPAALTIVQGATGSSTVTITRTNFAGEIGAGDRDGRAAGRPLDDRKRCRGERHCEIGRASCRERVEIAAVGGALKRKSESMTEVSSVRSVDELLDDC